MLSSDGSTDNKKKLQTRTQIGRLKNIVEKRINCFSFAFFHVWFWIVFSTCSFLIHFTFFSTLKFTIFFFYFLLFPSQTFFLFFFYFFLLQLLYTFSSLYQAQQFSSFILRGTELKNDFFLPLQKFLFCMYKKITNGN